MHIYLILTQKNVFKRIQTGINDFKTCITDYEPEQVKRMV
jgi:hypothetical protein